MTEKQKSLRKNEDRVCMLSISYCFASFVLFTEDERRKATENAKGLIASYSAAEVSVYLRV